MSIYIIIMNLPYSYETYSVFVCATIRTFNSTTIPNSNNGRVTFQSFVQKDEHITASPSFCWDVLGHKLAEKPMPQYTPRI